MENDGGGNGSDDEGEEGQDVEDQQVKTEEVENSPSECTLNRFPCSYCTHCRRCAAVLEVEMKQTYHFSFSPQHTCDRPVHATLFLGKFMLFVPSSTKWIWQVFLGKDYNPYKKGCKHNHNIASPHILFMMWLHCHSDLVYCHQVSWKMLGVPISKNRDLQDHCMSMTLINPRLSSPGPESDPWVLQKW